MRLSSTQCGVLAGMLENHGTPNTMQIEQNGGAYEAVTVVMYMPSGTTIEKTIPAQLSQGWSEVAAVAEP